MTEAQLPIRFIFFALFVGMLWATGCEESTRASVDGDVDLDIAPPADCTNEGCPNDFQCDLDSGTCIAPLLMLHPTCTCPACLLLGLLG